MGMIRIDRNPARRQLNLFGALWLLALGLLGCIAFGRGGPMQIAVWAAAIVVPAVGWLAPKFMRIVYLAMVYAAFPIGLVVSHVIMAIVYYLVLTPIGVLRRLLGRDPMTRRFEPDARTYWIPRLPPENIDRYFRQY